MPDWGMTDTKPKRGDWWWGEALIRQLRWPRTGAHAHSRAITGRFRDQLVLEAQVK